MKDVVFYLHRVYPESKTGVNRDDINLKGFVRALNLLRQRFKLVPLEALFEEKSEERRAAITFDDGYADNFVYAYPVLKKLGIPAHVFISTDRIGEGGIRRTLEDYWNGKVSWSELFLPSSMFQAHVEFVEKGKSQEFLTWEELNAMKDVFSFGSHGRKHFSFPYKDRIVNFYDGRKPNWKIALYAGSCFIGAPVFPTRSELAGRRFFPSGQLLEFCREFPKADNWKEKLRREISKRFSSLGAFEDENVAMDRIRDELITSKEIVEKRLGVSTSSFAWPFGHYTEFSLNIASKVFRYILTTKRGIISEDFNPYEIPRVPLGKELFTVLGRVLVFSTDWGYSLYKRFKRGKVI